jgi:hypothetical protein
MALEITAAGDAKLVISGTTTELASIYSRIDFSFGRNGSDSYGKLYVYGAKAQYESGANKLLVLDGFDTQHSFTIDTATEEQSLETGHQKLKAWLEGLGYTVAIVDLPS